MMRTANGCCEDLRRKSALHINARDVCDQFFARAAYVLDASDERTYHVRASLSCQKSLHRIKAKRHVRPDTFCGKNGNRGNSCLCYWNLHDDVRVNPGQPARFRNNIGCLCCSHRSADITVYQIANPADLFFNRNAFLCDQAWIRGDAVDDAPLICTFELIEIGGVEKKSHLRRNYPMVTGHPVR